MNYAFQIVPLDQLRLYHGLLTAFSDPIDRHHALKLGACAVIVTELSEQCLLGIAEEKRQLAIWTRNQRSTVRLVRYKGASSMRGALNADISNAADRARSQLDELRTLAPQFRQLAESRLQLTHRYITPAEAKAYVPTYQSEVQKQRDAQASKSLAIAALVVGILICFVSPQLGVLILLVALVIWLTKRGEWASLKDAEKARARQIQEIEQERAVAAQFHAELTSAPEPEVDESAAPSLLAIASDLEEKYVFLDVACRDLNSRALSWQELAQEMMEAIEAPTVTRAPSLGIDLGPPPPPPPPLPAFAQRQNPEQSQVAEISRIWTASDERPELLHISHQRDGDDISFSLSIEQIRLILQNLGYKRLPKDFSSISSKAEERVAQFLATRIGVSYDSYDWMHVGGIFLARSRY